MDVSSSNLTWNDLGISVSTDGQTSAVSSGEDALAAPPKLWNGVCKKKRKCRAPPTSWCFLLTLCRLPFRVNWDY
jgi:hypothetical protein